MFRTGSVVIASSSRQGPETLAEPATKTRPRSATRILSKICRNTSSPRSSASETNQVERLEEFLLTDRAEANHPAADA